MVVEHLPHPSACILELARALNKGGKLIIHTVNLWGYHTLLAMLSKLIPFPFRRKLVASITGREAHDIFPTYYRCNTARAITKLLRKAGLSIQEVWHLDAGIGFRSILPLAVMECLYIRSTSLESLRWLRGQLLITATKL